MKMSKKYVQRANNEWTKVFEIEWKRKWINENIIGTILKVINWCNELMKYWILNEKKCRKNYFDRMKT